MPERQSAASGPVMRGSGDGCRRFSGPTDLLYRIPLEKCNQVIGRIVEENPTFAAADDPCVNSAFGCLNKRLCWIVRLQKSCCNIVAKRKDSDRQENDRTRRSPCRSVGKKHH